MAPSDDTAITVSLPAALYHNVVRPMLEFYGTTTRETPPQNGWSEAAQRAEKRKALLIEEAVRLAAADGAALVARLLAPKNCRAAWAKRLLGLYLQHDRARLREEISRLDMCALRRLVDTKAVNKRPPSEVRKIPSGVPEAPAPLPEWTEQELVAALSGWPLATVR